MTSHAPTRITSRVVAAGLTALLVVGLTGGVVAAETPVRRMLLERRATVERAQEIRRQLAAFELDLRHRIDVMQRVVRAPLGPGGRGEDVRRPRTLAVTDQLLLVARARLRSLDPWLRQRLRPLRDRYEGLQAWLDRQGVFRVCPVPGYTTINDDFGRIVRLPHVPVHVHQGNDIVAPTGSPIVAPFDGYASTSRGKLGGIEIRVFGPAGYVYNAHASALGKLGWVSTGDVVGYVGSTGDATGPHDHLEWHPGDGPAQDPHALLVAACVDVGTEP